LDPVVEMVLAGLAEVLVEVEKLVGVVVVGQTVEEGAVGQTVEAVAGLGVEVSEVGLQTKHYGHWRKILLGHWPDLLLPRL